MSGNGKTLVIRNGTLIDGTGDAASQNDAVVIESNRFTSVGQLPPGLNLEDTSKVEVIDAEGKWVMPGLIDGHCHLSFGFPAVSGTKYPSGRGTVSPGFNAIRAARNAQTVLRSGVTSISIPGGTWFIEVGLRDAINAGLVEGPRLYTAGRFIVTYGSIGDPEPSWVGTPEHLLGVLANDVNDMITEVRRQTKHGVLRDAINAGLVEGPRL
jgi:imidazolonepropionase-like amidohydrolase